MRSLKKREKVFNCTITFFDGTVIERGTIAENAAFAADNMLDSLFEVTHSPEKTSFYPGTAILIIDVNEIIKES